MNIEIIASSKEGYIAEKQAFDNFSGKAAGVCYMKSNFNDLVNEAPEKTQRRIVQTKEGGHHSVYDHDYITLYFEGIPKMLAMILNNEHMYTTSEKSGRYTKLVVTEKEEEIFNKWFEIFKSKITSLYQKDYPNFFTDSRIEKLAFENARYTTSVFSRACMIYTTSYRQLNILIALIDDYIKDSPTNAFEERLHEELQDFVDKLKALPYFDEMLSRNEKYRHLSLFAKGDVEEYYGDVFCAKFKATFSSLAHLHRHRTLNFAIKVLEDEYYVPEMIKEDEALVAEWIADLKNLNNFPQAILLEVQEMGTFDNFILKLKERKCSAVLLETNMVVNEVLKKYSDALDKKGHARADELKKYTKGSRCTFPDYKCPKPCAFLLGINETRIV